VAIQRFKLTDPTMATAGFSECLISIPAGTILSVDSDDMNVGTSVLVEWEGRLVTMFAADLLQRAERMIDDVGA
jgi:hypothetical protein